MKYFVWIVFFFIRFLSFSQMTIIGNVVDQKTGEALPYVNITLKHTHYGTVTNEEGRFKFVLPQNAKLPITLSYSYIGFKTKDVVFEAIKNPVKIFLTPIPITLNDVRIKEKNKPTTVKELLKNAWENYQNNTLTDTVCKTYYARNFAKTEKYFFSEENFFSTLDNNMTQTISWAYDMRLACDYLRRNKEILSVGAWEIDWTSYDVAKWLIKYYFKHYKRAFRDTVYAKDDHLIFVVVYSNKLKKEDYKNITDTLKMEPIWAISHNASYDFFVKNNIELGILFIDKTDNYKVLKLVNIETNDAISELELMKQSFKNVGNKLILSNTQSYLRKTNKKKDFYVNKYEELLLINTEPVDSCLFLNNGNTLERLDSIRNHVLRINCEPNTSFGDFSKYNILESDSLKLKVISDLKELNKTTGNSSKYKK